MFAREVSSASCRKECLRQRQEVCNRAKKLKEFKFEIPEARAVRLSGPCLGGVRVVAAVRQWGGGRRRRGKGRAIRSVGSLGSSRGERAPDLADAAATNVRHGLSGAERRLGQRRAMRIHPVQAAVARRLEGRGRREVGAQELRWCEAVDAQGVAVGCRPRPLLVSERPEACAASLLAR